MAKTWYPLLDVFRVLAAFAVMMGHFRTSLFPAYSNLPSKGLVSGAFYFATSLGHSAVIVFFVLSGFLVGGGVRRSIRNGSFVLSDFALNRAVRIFLPLWGAIALFSCLVWLGVPISFREAFLNALCLQVFLVPPLLGPYWALPIEVLFYVLIGACACVWTYYGWRRYVSGVVMVLALVLFYRIGLSYLVVFLLGMLVAFNTPREWSVWKFLLSCGMFLGTLLIAQRISDYKVGDLLFGLGFAMLVRESICFNPKTFSHKLLSPFSFVSRFSYSIYIVHMIVMVILTNFLFTTSKDCPMTDVRYFNLDGPGRIECFADFTVRTFFLWLIAVMIAVAVSWLFYEVIEKRTKNVISLIKRIIN